LKSERTLAAVQILSLQINAPDKRSLARVRQSVGQKARQAKYKHCRCYAAAVVQSKYQLTSFV
jgi:hypothetical protein